MKNRYLDSIRIVIILLLLPLALSSCTDNIEYNDVEKEQTAANMTKKEYRFGKFTVNNRAKLSDMELTEYELSELEGFFKTSDDTTMSAVNERFPIECLRCRKWSEDPYSLYYYTVYKVSGGGYYYAFWKESYGFYEVSDKLDAPTEYEWGAETSPCRYFTYINSDSYNNISSFENLSGVEHYMLQSGITIGEMNIIDIIQELLTIDPYIEIYYSENFMYVYSLLDDGTVLCISYSFRGSETAVLYTKNVGSKNQYVCCLSSIYTSDLP